MSFSRRRFLQAFGAAAAISATPSLVRALNNQKIVIVGGGFAGATAAKYLRLWSGGTLDVTLVEPKANHTSCVLSNLVLNKRIALSELRLSYQTLASTYGVNVIRDRAVEIDGSGHKVRLKNNGWQTYDHMILAPGIAFKKPRGTDFRLTPHAWIAGKQTQLLASKVNSLGPQSTFIMTIPASPYRCPPGPYERACLVADILKRRGYDNGDARVLVLDANSDIQAERHTFERAFSGIYRNIIDYRTNTPVTAVDSAAGLVESGMKEFSGDVVNIIAPQRAVGFVRKSGLTDGGSWADVDPLTYESTVVGFDGIHIIGDSQATNQPKSAHMANAHAKVCADAIIRSVAGSSNRDPERIPNVTTNSACYSPITYDEASWLTANFAYDPATGQMGLTHLGEAERWSRENYEEMFAWASNLFTDSFH